MYLLYNLVSVDVLFVFVAAWGACIYTFCNPLQCVGEEMHATVGQVYGPVMYHAPTVNGIH